MKLKETVKKTWEEHEASIIICTYGIDCFALGWYLGEKTLAVSADMGWLKVMARFPDEHIKGIPKCLNILLEEMK